MNDSQETRRIEKKRDEKPSRTILQLARMGMVYFGIELIFSIEIALTVPILLKLKVSEKLEKLAYPILGSMSDRCENPMGRRRPFILALSFLAFLGISLILNGYSIGQFFGDANSEIPMVAIILVGLGVTLLDFSADSCDSPVRAFLLDECNSKDQDTGLNIHAFLGGVGAASGYFLTSIDWDKTILGKVIGDEMQIIFIIVSIIFFLCVFATMTSAREEQFKPRRPKSFRSKNEPSSRISKLEQLAASENQNLTLDILDINKDRLNSYSEYDEEERPLGIRTLFLSFIYMPNELNRLFVCQTIGWMAFFSTTLFFTDFIAQSIYKGDPSAAINSSEFYLYNYGTKMGSLCLLFFSISSAISAVFVEKYFSKEFSTKTIFLFSYMYYVVCCVAIYSLDSVYSIIPFCSSFGLLMTILTTLPYQMLSEFHQDENYLNNCKTASRRGMGIDCSLLSSSFFFSQLVISTFMSLLISYCGNRVILVAGGFFAFIGFIYIHLYVIFPKNNASTKYKENQN